MHAGRPRRGAGRQALARARAVSRVPARGSRVPAAQHRVPEERARLFLRRREAARHRVQQRPPRRRGGAGRRCDRAHDRGGASTAPSGVRRDFRDGASRAGRPCDHSLHLGHDGPLQGRDDHASQSRVERDHARRCVGVHARRRAAARAAHLSRARAVRRDALRAARGRAHAVAAEVRRARSRVAAAAGDGDDGRADVLHAPAVRARVHARCLRVDPPLRVRLRAAPRRDVRGVRASAPATRSSSATA